MNNKEKLCWDINKNNFRNRRRVYFTKRIININCKLDTNKLELLFS